MGRYAYAWGLIGAGAFAGSVMVLMPPTSLKANWAPVEATPHMGAATGAMAEPEAVTYAPVPQLYHLDEMRREQPDADPRYADDPDMREEMTIASHDRAYGDGYAWAADRALDGPEACGALNGDRRDGCLDYVRSL